VKSVVYRCPANDKAFDITDRAAFLGYYIITHTHYAAEEHRSHPTVWTS